MRHHVSLWHKPLGHIWVTPELEESIVTVLPGSANTHSMRRKPILASCGKSQKWMLKGPRSMHPRVVWEALTYLEGHLRPEATGLLVS